MPDPAHDPSPTRDPSRELSFTAGGFGDGPIELEPLLVAPRPALPGNVIIRQTADEVIDVMGAEFMLHAKACLRAFGDFQLALAYSPENEVFFRRLMYDPLLRDLPWSKTHLWIVEDWRVPFHHPRSCFTAIREWIIDHSDIPPEQVHPIFTMGDDPDDAYQTAVREVLGWREKGHDRFDYVLLGPQPDARTLGFYPGSPAISAGDRLVCATMPAGETSMSHEIDQSAASSATGRMESPAQTISAVMAPLQPDAALPASDAAPDLASPESPASDSAARATAHNGAISLSLRMVNAARVIAVLGLGARWRDAIKGMAHPMSTGNDWPLLHIKPMAGELRWYLDYDACGVE
jgi:6-phosphogluconolactonase/glucosamine-6-phosphate isomerase/deaminase